MRGLLLALVAVCWAGRDESVARLRLFCETSSFVREGSLQCSYGGEQTNRSLIVEHGYHGATAHGVLKGVVRKPNSTTFYVECPEGSAQGSPREWSRCRRLSLKPDESFPLIIKTSHREKDRAPGILRESWKIRRFQSLRAPITGHPLTPKLVEADRELPAPLRDEFILMEKFSGTQVYALFNLLRTQMKQVYKAYIIAGRRAKADAAVRSEVDSSIRRLWLIVRDNYDLVDLLLRGVSEHLWSSHVAHCDLHLLNIFLLDHAVPSSPDAIRAAREKGLFIIDTSRGDRVVGWSLETKSLRYIDVDAMLNVTRDCLRPEAARLPCGRCDAAGARMEDLGELKRHLYHILFKENRSLASEMAQLLDPPAKRNGLHRITSQEQLLAREIEGALKPLRTVWEDAEIVACVPHLGVWMKGPSPERHAAFKNPELACPLERQITLARMLRQALKIAKDKFVISRLSTMASQ